MWLNGDGGSGPFTSEALGEGRNRIDGIGSLDSHFPD